MCKLIFLRRSHTNKKRVTRNAQPREAPIPISTAMADGPSLSLTPACWPEVDGTAVTIVVIVAMVVLMVSETPRIDLCALLRVSSGLSVKLETEQSVHDHKSCWFESKQGTRLHPP